MYSLPSVRLLRNAYLLYKPQCLQSAARENGSIFVRPPPKSQKSEVLKYFKSLTGEICDNNEHGLLQPHGNCLIIKGKRSFVMWYHLELRSRYHGVALSTRRGLPLASAFLRASIICICCVSLGWSRLSTQWRSLSVFADADSISLFCWPPHSNCLLRLSNRLFFMALNSALMKPVEGK
jgi:hypothetical protein